MSLKRFLIISLVVLWPSLVLAAGTWSHQILRQKEKPWGIEVTVAFQRDVTGERSVHTFRFDSQEQIDSEGPTRLANKKARLELAWSELNRFDLGEDSRDILISMIKWIRNNPTATIAQGCTAYNTAYPDALWSCEQFLLRLRRAIEKAFGVTPTWEQFKTYVINNVFEGVDG